MSFTVCLSSFLYMMQISNYTMVEAVKDISMTVSSMSTDRMGGKYMSTCFEI